MNRREQLDQLAREATMSANLAIVRAIEAGDLRIPADATRIGIRAALHALEANGHIRFTLPTGRYQFQVSPPEEDDR